MTVLEGIQKSADFLGRKGVESPRLQAELLLAQVLKLARMKLYLNFERGLSPSEIDAFRERVRRRGQREPLQHILGSTSFCGLELAVNRHVLIPRPETELLAELGWQFLGGRDAPAAALDLGTGSGCLAIALAVKCPGAQIAASDISTAALEVAAANAARHQVAERIQFFRGDAFGPLPAGVRYDLLLSNPPYIPTAEISGLQPEVRDHDPRPALDGGPDGLDYYRVIATQAAERLKPDARLMVEFGDGQAEALREVFSKQNWIVEAVKEDYSRRPRFLVARRPG